MATPKTDKCSKASVGSRFCPSCHRKTITVKREFCDDCVTMMTMMVQEDEGKPATLTDDNLPPSSQSKKSKGDKYTEQRSSLRKRQKNHHPSVHCTVAGDDITNERPVWGEETLEECDNPILFTPQRPQTLNKTHAVTPPSSQEDLLQLESTSDHDNEGNLMDKNTTQSLRMTNVEGVKDKEPNDSTKTAIDGDEKVNLGNDTVQLNIQIQSADLTTKTWLMEAHSKRALVYISVYGSDQKAKGLVTAMTLPETFTPTKLACMPSAGVLGSQLRGKCRVCGDETKEYWHHFCNRHFFDSKFRGASSQEDMDFQRQNSKAAADLKKSKRCLDCRKIFKADFDFMARCPDCYNVFRSKKHGNSTSNKGGICRHCNVKLRDNFQTICGNCFHKANGPMGNIFKE